MADGELAIPVFAKATILGQRYRFSFARFATDCRNSIPRLPALTPFKSCRTTFPTLRWRTAGKQQAPLIVRTRVIVLKVFSIPDRPMAGIINLVSRYARIGPSQYDPGSRFL